MTPGLFARRTQGMSIHIVGKMTILRNPTLAESLAKSARAQVEASYSLAHSASLLRGLFPEAA